MTATGGASIVSCAGCGAPARLSLASTEQPCPSCGAPLDLPPEARAHIAATQRLLGDKLAMARRVDAATGRVSEAERGAITIAVFLVLLSCGGFEAFSAIWAVIDKGFEAAWPVHIVSAVAGIGAALSVTFGGLLAHRWVRRGLSRTFAAGAPAAGAPHGICHACGGPLPPVDREGSASVRCGHCGCDNLHGRDVVARTAADVGGALARHAEEMLRAMKRVRVATMLIGYTSLVLIPALSLAAWMSVSWLLDQL